MAVIGKYTINHFKKFVHAIQFSPSELEKYYDISPELWGKIKSLEGDGLILSKPDKDKIEQCVNRFSSTMRIPVTDDLLSKLRELRKKFGGNKTSQMIHQDTRMVNRTLKGDYKTTSLRARQNINKLYHEYKCDLVKGKKNGFKDTRHLSHIEYNEYQKALVNSRKYLKLLEVGKTYRIYEHMKDSKLNPDIVRFEGTIVEEYRNYYLGVHKGRTVTFLKNLLFLPQYRVEEVKQNEISQLPQ